MFTKLKVSRVMQSGFTLLEVLITLIILSVGLLGLAGLQTMSLRNNHSAYLRSQAITQSYDIVDRMRANSGQIAAYSLLNASYTFAAIGTLNNNCDKTAGCTSNQMALHDLYRWNQSLRSKGSRNALPLGIGIICRDGSMEDDSYDLASDTVTTGCTGAAADPLVVKVWWVDDRADPPVPSRFSTVIGDQL